MFMLEVRAKAKSLVPVGITSFERLSTLWRHALSTSNNIWQAQLTSDRFIFVNTCLTGLNTVF